jgi:hypothetical protein
MGCRGVPATPTFSSAQNDFKRTPTLTVNLLRPSNSGPPSTFEPPQLGSTVAVPVAPQAEHEPLGPACRLMFAASSGTYFGQLSKLHRVARL